MAKDLVSKVQALRTAKEIGCSGAHQDDSGNWLPCESPEKLMSISDTAETSKWRSVVPGYKPSSKKQQPNGRSSMGRIKKRKKDWEELGEAPIRGIEAIPGVGIVSGNSFAGKALQGSGANVGPEYVSESSPDVFIDPESARNRAKQIGCIGISRRVSKSGRTVWMPCTNMTDYNNRTGATSLGRRNIEKDSKKRTERAIRTVLTDRAKKLLTRKKSIARELI